MQKELRFAVGIMGNCSSLLLYMSPVPTFVRVIREKSVGQYSCTPYVIALFNCFIYTWYGMPVVSKGWENFLVSTVCGTAIIPQTFVICTFLVLAPPKAKLRVVRMIVTVVVLFTIIALVSTFALHQHKSRKFLVGIVGLITTVTMLASPLFIMKMVIATKSVEFMPFYLSFFGLLSSIFWATYGVLGRDALIATPSAIGVPLGIAQLLLYCTYRKKKETCDSENSSNLENGEGGGINNGEPIFNTEKIKLKADMEVDGTILLRKDNHNNDQPI